MKDNAFARRLAKDLISNYKVPDYSELLVLLYSSDSPADLNFPVKNRRADRRIKTLYLKDIRQYCLSHNKEKTADFYSLDFRVEDNAASTILLGPNGTGKTSLYSSLEYLYQGHSEIASSHGHNKDQINNFFRSIGSPLNSAQIDAQFVKDEEIKSNHLQGYELPAAFCSECDYFEISRNWDNIDQYIARQLGYGEMIETLERLTILTSLLKISSDYKRLNEKIARQDEIIDNASKYKKSEVGKAKIEQISLEKSANAYRTNFEKIRGDKYSKRIDDFLYDDNKKLLDDSKLREVEDTLNYVKRVWTERLQDFLKSAVSIFNKMMTEHLFKGSESLKMSVEGGVFNINLGVIGNGYKENPTPISYLNTFRLKLFCVAFKMSLFCCAKDLYQINLPFVIDDIFDSSDFYHRSNIGTFIWHMIESHNEVMISKDKIKFPLQLIFFTQDNIIAQNVYRGMSDFIFENGLEENMKIKFGRLFRPCDARLPNENKNPEASESHVSDEKLRGKDTKVIKIVDYYSES